MIRVRRPDEPPAVLRVQGARARQAHCEAFDAGPDAYRDGSKRISFKKHVYKHETVRAALHEAQHGKCCYCECKTRGEVEHYRPKGGVRQKEGGPLRRPGYYWLAYEWSNLLLSCNVCNQIHKRSLFPLAPRSQRATSHHDDIGHEQPLLIDPSAQDPDEFLRFRGAILYARGGNRVGRCTIQVLKLNDRPELLEARRKHLALLRLLKKNRDLLAARISRGQASPGDVAHLKELDAYLAGLVHDSAEYAAMTRAVLSP